MTISRRITTRHAARQRPRRIGGAVSLCHVLGAASGGAVTVAENFPHRPTRGSVPAGSAGAADSAEPRPTPVTVPVTCRNR